MTREERENAIKVIKNYDLNFHKINGLLFKAEEIASAFDCALEALEQEPKTEWIPVTEKLPKEGEEVLVWYEYFRYGDYNCMWQTYGIGWQYDEHFSVNNGGVKQRVIAWCPLPKPYQSEVSE